MLYILFNHYVNNNDDIVSEKKQFKYLRSMVQKNADFKKDVRNRIMCGQIKSRETSGILCDKRVLLRLKGRFYKAVEEDMNRKNRKLH